MQATLRQMTIGKNANAVGWVIVTMYIFGPALRELTSQECRNAEHCLWAHDEQKQIDKMREFYDLLPVKPEWLTREQIDEYAARMGVK